MTVVVSFICVLLLPDWPATTRWLSDAEKRLALQQEKETLEAKLLEV